MKEQVNVRVSRATRTKLDWLTTRYGTQAEAVAVAVDGLHRAECAMIHGYEAVQQKGNVNKGTVVSARVIRRGDLHTHDVIVRLVSDPERLHTYTTMDYLDRVLEYGIESQDNAKAVADQSLGTTQDDTELLAGGVEYYGDTCVYVTALKAPLA